MNRLLILAVLLGFVSLPCVVGCGPPKATDENTTLDTSTDDNANVESPPIGRDNP